MAEAPLVKICGLRRREDVVAADRLGADYVGIVLSAGFGRSVEPAQAASLTVDVRPTPVAVLVDEEPAAAAALADGIGAGVVQLHGRESVDAVRELALLGSWRLWKCVRASTPDDVLRTVDRYGPFVHGILVEGRLEGVVGGGGAALDQDAFPALRALVPSTLQLVLAGGLTPDTVGPAVARWRPDVVDVSSGVEVEPGRKDHDLLRRFIRAARGDDSTGTGTSSEDHGVSR